LAGDQRRSWGWLPGVNYSPEAGKWAVLAPSNNWFGADFTPKLAGFQNSLSGKSAFIYGEALGTGKVGNRNAGHSYAINNAMRAIYAIKSPSVFGRIDPLLLRGPLYSCAFSRKETEPPHSIATRKTIAFLTEWSASAHIATAAAITPKSKTVAVIFEGIAN
jgi:hypothetical protein